MSEGLTLDVAARAVAAALLHSVWQGALAAGLAALALRLLRGASAQARYAVACAALAGLVGAWSVTAIRSATTLAAERAGTATPAAPLLGPGPLDFSSAIQPLPPPNSSRAAVGRSWRSRLEGWSAAAVPLWLAGVVLLSLRLIVEWIALERLRRVRLAPVADDLGARMTALAHALGVWRPVRLAHSAVVHVPSVVGWLRPVILLPVSAVSGLSPAQLDAVLAHELAHIRRHDFAVNALQTVADVLLFYHPACWWVSRRIRVEREHCCDDVAVAACGDRLIYASALADLEALRQQPALALAATDGPLLQRVRRLVAPPRGASSPALAVLAVPLVALAIVIAAAVATRAAQPPQAPEELRAPGVGRTVPADRGIVQGRVVDSPAGRPLAGAKVEVRGTSGAVFVAADTDGRYETPALTPGSYTVSVTAPGHAVGFYGSSTGRILSTGLDVRAGALVTGIDVVLRTNGQLSGRILDDRGRGLAGVYVELLATRASETGAFPGVAYAQSESDGAYRVTAPPGDYVVRAYIGRHIRPSRDAALAYVATFYPSVRAQPEAQVVRVDAGLEQYDVDFALVSIRTVRVSGIVVDPARDNLEDVRVSLRAVPSASGERGVDLELNARGEFDTRDVAPGTYQVYVSDPRLHSRWNAARRQIEITDDVSGLEIRASTAASVTGRLVRDPRSSSKLDLGQVAVGFVLKGPEAAGPTMGTLETTLDGSFRGEVPAGPLTLSVFGPADWRVRSVVVDGVESFGRLVDVAPGSHDIEVVLTDRHSSVEGLVVDRRGAPLAGFDVVLFSPDAASWYVTSPFVRQTRSRQNGRFETGLLPPGDYLAVATEGVPLLMLGDPEPTLQRLQSIATRLTVRDGERKTISIRASPTPEGLVRFTP